MQSWFQFEIDGEVCRVESEDIHRSLADYLAELDPIYAHYANAESWLGGQPVILAEKVKEAYHFRTADAYLLLLPMLADRQIWTAEGIKMIGRDHPVVEILSQPHLECGAQRYSLLATLFFEGYYRPDLRRHGQMNDQFDALVSRTANAPAIRKAGSKLFTIAEKARHAASSKLTKSGQDRLIWTGAKDAFTDKFSTQLFRCKDRGSFQFADRHKNRFYRPKNLVELLALKHEYPQAQIAAGGTELAQYSGETRWAQLISLECVDELVSLHAGAEYWEIGAAVNLTRIAEQIGREYPIFLKAMSRFGSRPIRNRATLGGNLAAAWQSSQIAPLLIALDARVKLVSRDGERDAAVSQFFDNQGRTILQPNEVIKTIFIPRSNDTALAERGMTSKIADSYTVAPRQNLCEPFVTGAFSVELRENIIAKAWIAYSGIGKAPVRARKAEDLLSGKPWKEASILEALEPLYKEATVTRDEVGQASKDYRKQLVMTLFQKFFYEHPTADATRPQALGAERDFSHPNQPFFDAVDV